MAQTAVDPVDIQDEIELHEGFLLSLAHEPDAHRERERIAAKLTDLRSHLSEMNYPEHGWDDSGHPRPKVQTVSDLQTASTQGSAASPKTFTGTDYASYPRHDPLELLGRKRERPDDDWFFPSAKSQKSTPQPQPPSRAASVDSFDFFDDFDVQETMKNVLGVDWQEQEAKEKDYYQKQADKKRQEEEDAAFARLLEQRWNESSTGQQPQPKIPLPAPATALSSSSPSAALRPSYAGSGSTSQSSRPIPPQLPILSVKSEIGPSIGSHIKPEMKPGYKTDHRSSGAWTPSTDSSSGLEEISARDWNNHLRPGWQSSSAVSTTPNAWPTSNMPGSFPTTSFGPSFGTPGSLVYPNRNSTGTGVGTGARGVLSAPSFASPSSSPSSSSAWSTLAGPIHGGLNGGLYSRNFNLGMPGSFNLPFDLDLMLSPPPQHNQRVHHVSTHEDLKELLKQIRPDEELTEEQQRERQPDALKIRLMPHQCKGYAWMKGMEEGSNKGGILADDMGLGKTVQSLALILGRPPDPDAKLPTLIVAPVALLQQWKREIKKFVRPEQRLQVLILHGENRNSEWSSISKYDVILTTYGTLSSDLKRQLFWDTYLLGNPDARPRPQQRCPILGQQSSFHRVILDEAQNIKNRNTKAALAACKIRATYRWCLSGTPMQNNVDEIYSLIKFCRIRPYHEYEKFAQDIGRPLKRTNDWGKESAMKQLQAILRAILLRRTKDSKIDGKPIIQLPEKNIVRDIAVFSQDEHDFYRQLEINAQIRFNRFLKAGTIGRNYSHALVMLLRLRQCCCSPQLVTNANDFLTTGSLDGVDHIENARALSEDVVRRLDENEDQECPICMDAIENAVIFVPCGHTLCPECLGAMVDKVMNEETQAKIACPHCRAEVDPRKVTNFESYLRVHHPDRPGVEPVEDSEEDDDVDTDSASSVSADDDDDDDDDGLDLKDFIVSDDEDVDGDADIDADHVDSDHSEPELHTILNRVKGEQREDDVLSLVKTPTPKSVRKPKKEKKSPRSKGKEKAKAKILTLAELRREGLKNKAAKKRYLRRLEKGFETSAKIDKTLALLREIQDRGQGEKTIVFSSFTSFLDLVEVPLHRDKDLSNYTRYDGSMKASDRNASVVRFTDDPNCKVMLVSLKAGNSGLNLTAANHVVILDPFWNPFVEHQAADRCYRIGQTREVTVHRVLIGESDEEPSEADDDRDFTVEDRILRLQEKKRKLVDMALDEKVASTLGRLTTRDLGFLFGVNSLE